MSAIEYAVWGTIAFSLVGMFVAAKWIGCKIGALAWKIDRWSERRTKVLIAQAILDHELARGVHMYAALDYAIYFALPGYVRDEWR